jgi:hypothetical protein
MAEGLDSVFDYVLNRVQDASMHHLDRHQINVACRRNRYLEVTFEDGLYCVRAYVDGEWDEQVATAPTSEGLVQALVAMGGKSVD